MCEYCENTFRNKRMKEINYCPYCGKRLNFKVPKLRSMSEIYSTFGWKPEGWSIDDINEELKLPEIKNNETIEIDFDISDPKKPGGYIFGKPDKHVEVIDKSSLHPCPQNSKEENDKLIKLINSVFGVPEKEEY